MNLASSCILMDAQHGRRSPDVLLNLHSSREEEIYRQPALCQSESYAIADSDCPIFDYLYENRGKTSKTKLINFTGPEFRTIYSKLRYMNLFWQTGMSVVRGVCSENDRCIVYDNESLKIKRYLGCAWVSFCNNQTKFRKTEYRLHEDAFYVVTISTIETFGDCIFIHGTKWRRCSFCSFPYAVDPLDVTCQLSNRPTQGNFAGYPAFEWRTKSNGKR